ncbi:MAG TPA: carboxy terminal-processing peptidase [Polyangiales bacterium]|nr:carboxy terminal-processing peptidase [Polyangiales bacterium]
MKTATRFLARARVALFAAMFAICGFTCATAHPAASAQSTEANITRLTASILGSSQFAHHPLDRELAAKFLDRYLDAIDGTRSLFLQTDVKELSGTQGAFVRATMDKGDTHLAHQIWQRYLERLSQRRNFTSTALDAGPGAFTFTGKETYQIDRATLPRPADMNAAQALWKLRLRAEYLDEKLAGTAEAEIPGKLRRRYDQQLKNMQTLRSDEVTTIYLNALASVYDPHSEYLGREQLESLEMAMSLKLFGIGATLESVDGVCTVREVLPGGPASKSTLGAGDRILAVGQADQTPVEITNLPLTRSVQLIRGPKGSRVTLMIAPAGTSDSTPPRKLVLTRDEVQLEDQQAKAAVIDLPLTHPLKAAAAPAPAAATAAAPAPAAKEPEKLRLGVIDLPSFYAGMDGKKDGSTRSVTADVARLLKKLKAEHVRGIVLDLRQNGGGSLDEAIRLTGLFIPKGPIVQTRGPDGDIEVENDPDPTEVYKGPLVVLISRMSASASEILAGALQDYGRAVVVGDSSTFGKGTVQSIMALAPIMHEEGLAFSFEPGALKVTIRKFYRPSGASTQLKGVASDIVIPSNTDVSQISESAQKDPLPWDVVAPANFQHQDVVKGHLKALRERSSQRISQGPGFGYLRDNISRVRERLKDSTVSLNEAQRRQELARDEARQREFGQAWKDAQKEAPRHYEIKLKDTNTAGLPAPTPFVSLEKLQQRRASSGDNQDAYEAALADAAASDTVLREAVQILSDFVLLLGPSKQAA